MNLQKHPSMWNEDILSGWHSMPWYWIALALHSSQRIWHEYHFLILMNHLSFSNPTHYYMSSFTTMAPLTNLHGVSKNLTPITCLPNVHRTLRRGHVVGFLGRKSQEFSECSVQSTRRAAAISFATLLLTGQFKDNVSLADNGFWIDGPLPEPIVINSKISSD